MQVRRITGFPLSLAVSIEADSDRVDQLLSELEGKSIEEVIASGVSKLSSVPSGGGGGGGAAAGGGGGAAAAGMFCVLLMLVSLPVARADVDFLQRAYAP